MNENLMSGEKFRDIPGYEGLYQVSNKGRVRNHRFKILSVSKRGNRSRVNLRKEEKGSSMNVSRLVAMAFVDNPNSYPFVIALDGDHENVDPGNLKWVETLKEANQNAVKNGIQYGRRLSEEQVISIKKEIGEGVKDNVLSEKYGISPLSVRRIRLGRTHTGKPRKSSSKKRKKKSKNVLEPGKVFVRY